MSMALKPRASLLSHPIPQIPTFQLVSNLGEDQLGRTQATARISPRMLWETGRADLRMITPTENPVAF